jgi:hypothetical protein
MRSRRKVKRVKWRLGKEERKGKKEQRGRGGEGVWGFGEGGGELG